MRRMTLHLLCFAAIAGLCSTNANAQSAGGVKFAAEVPLLDCNGMPCVEGADGERSRLENGD